MRLSPRFWSIAFPLGLGLVSCADDREDSSSVAVRVSAINRPVTYVNPAGYWNTSAVGGDRGTTWLQFPGGDFTNWEWLQAPSGYGETYVREIPFGPDPGNKPPTVYFRTTFHVPNLAYVHSLRLDVMYDDGFVAYINGQEVKRAHMPDGPVGYSTLATGHEANNTYVSFDISAARSVLKTGSNTLSIEVHQASASSSDLVFDAGLVGDAWFDPPPPSHGVILGNDEWSFWDRGGDLGTAWRESNFDASAWDFAVGVFGYGESFIGTPMSFGANPANKHITTYFRKQFVVDQPASAAGLDGYVLFDDGIVVYLNGQPIGRASMPSGPTTAATLALGHEADLGTYQHFDWSAYRHLLVQGVNTIAVEVHQASPSSSDLVFDMSLGVQGIPPSMAGPSTIARRAPWKYHAQGGELGAAWRGLGYDDALWAQGAAPLGYGESYLQTTVSGPSSGGRPITTYFRKTFDVDLPASFAVTAILGELMFDDGAVIYLNGHEVLRASLPAGAVGAATLATAHEAGNAYEPFDLAASAQHIVPGTNVIAVEVHQVAASSSDLVFDLSLDVQTAPQFRKYSGNPVIERQETPGDFTWQRHIHSPSVIKLAGGSWVMYYTGTDGFGPHDMIGRAVSTDGIEWTLGDDPVVTTGHIPTVVFDGAMYRMWMPHQLERGIWYASSTDGISWSQRPGPMIGSSFEATVIKDGDVFRMWHRASTAGGYAISTDGVNWTHHPSLVFSAAGSTTVIKDGGEFKMWVSEPAGLRYATSPDGIQWRRRGLSLRSGVDGDWDAHVDRVSVVRDGPALKMWYTGRGIVNGDSTVGIGYATSP